MSEILLVGSKTRAALKAQGVNVGGDALDALNEVVHWYIDQAAKRAAANRRKTVRGHDFIVIEVAADRPAEPPTPAESHVERPPDPPTPAAPHEDVPEAAPVGVDQAPIAVADSDEAVEEAAEEKPPEAWST